MQRLYILVITILFSLSIQVAIAAIPRDIEKAIELYQDGRWIDARLKLLKVREELNNDNPYDFECIDFYLAMCAIELDSSNAEEYLNDFESRYPASTYLNNIRFAKAMMYCSDERYSEAQELFESVNYASLTRQEQEGYNVRMGYIYFLDKNYTDAKKHLSEIDAKSPVYDHALYYISYIDYIEGNNSAAHKGFTSLLKSDAYSAVAPFYLLQIEFNEGKYSEVLVDGEKLYGRSTEMRRRELVRSMAEAAFRLEDYSKAISYMERYKNSGGSMGREENYILGFSLYRNVRFEEAVSYLRAASGADDALTQNASYHLADCYIRLGDKSSASASFAMASNELFNKEIAEDALFNYAKLQYELGDDKFNETINTLTRYINKYPNSGERYEQAKELLIAAYYNSRNFDAAYKSIKELAKPDSDIKLALQRITLYRALESYNLGDYQKATNLINESLEVNISPKYSSIARFYLGEMAFVEGKYGEALGHYNSYIASAPKEDTNYIMALYNIAYAKYALGSESEALGYYQRFIEATAGDTFYRADALNRAGDIFYGRRQFEEARQNYRRATWSTFEPRHYAQYQSAIIEGIVGEYDAKVKRLKTIISSGEGRYIEAASYELGRSYIAASDYRSGVEAHEAFVGSYPSSGKYAQALSDLGLAYLNLGDSKKSLKYYDKAIKAAPQSTVAKDALQGVREIYINNGDANGYFKYAASVGHSGDIDNMMRDSLSFASAQRLYLNSVGNSIAAADALNDYVNDYPQGYYTLDALYFLSDSYEKLGKNSDAISTLILLTKKGTSQYSERVYDRLSSLSFNEKQHEQASSAYLDLYKITSKEDVKARALVGYADATLMGKSDREIIKMSDYIAAQSDADTKLIVKVKHAKAQILFTNGSKKDALDIFKELSDDPQSPEGAEATFRLIEAEFDAGHIDVAEQMIFDFAQSDTTQAYFLARSFILLGDIYVLRGDNFQARATYQSIIDGYGDDQSDEIVSQAKSKIDKLEK